MKSIHQKWLQSFLENCRQTNKSPRTIINYEADLKKYIYWYEAHFNRPLNKANSQTISLYKQFLSGGHKNTSSSDTLEVRPVIYEQNNSPRGLFKKVFVGLKRLWPKKKKSEHTRNLVQLPSPVSLAVASRRRHLSAIKNFYEFLKQSHEDTSDLFSANPVKDKLHGIRLKEEDVVPTVLLTRADWAQMEKAIYRPKERLLVNLLYYGGLRLSEVTHLKVTDFNWDNRSLTFARKGGHMHTLFPQNAAYLFELLDLHLKFRPHDGPYLFSNKKGRPYSTRAMYNLLIRIFLKSNCPTPGLTPHSFRKACATNLYHETKDLIQVRDYLNHSDAKVTQTYIERLGTGDPKTAN